jgi:hypothetical protein
VGRLVDFLLDQKNIEITGKLISAVWDNLEDLHNNTNILRASDLLTLRRITPGDRGFLWGSND